MRLRPAIRAASSIIAVLAGWYLAPAGSIAVSTAFAEVPVEAQWRLEQPPIPTSTATGSEGEALPPDPLGHIGAFSFWAPNRGLLITQGQPPAIPAGIWSYNGIEWHELASVCGASTAPSSRYQPFPAVHGSLAWSSPNEFWSVSDGRAGQANETGLNGELVEVPLEDNTLCHFAHGQLVASYAHPADQANSYMTINAALCPAALECWFAGNRLPGEQIGAFRLQYTSAGVSNVPLASGKSQISSLAEFNGHVYAAVGPEGEASGGTPPPLIYRFGIGGSASAEEGKFAELQRPGQPGSLLGREERATELTPLKLAAGESALWAAAAGTSSAAVGTGGCAGKRPPAASEGQLTVMRASAREWKQLIGWEHPLPDLLPTEEAVQLLGVCHLAEASLAAIAVEPLSESLWLALKPREKAQSTAESVLVHLSKSGTLLGLVKLPSEAELIAGSGSRGAPQTLTCPAAEDCWLATVPGWLYHLAPESARQLGRDPAEGEYFDGPITYRPPDEGLPQAPADTPPADNSGSEESTFEIGHVLAATSKPSGEARESVPLLSHLSSRIIGGHVLQMSFKLAVRARVRLIARRHGRLVAATPMRTLRAGRRRLLLALDRRRWPTSLELKRHALAKLPTVSARVGSGGEETISTGFAAPRRLLQEMPGGLQW